MWAEWAACKFSNDEAKKKLGRGSGRKEGGKKKEEKEEKTLGKMGKERKKGKRRA